MKLTEMAWARSAARATRRPGAPLRVGFAGMLRRISSRLVLLYGAARGGLLPEGADGVQIWFCPSRW